MSQRVREGVDLVQLEGQTVDGEAKEGENQGFPSGDVLVELVVGRDVVCVVDA